MSYFKDGMKSSVKNNFKNSEVTRKFLLNKLSEKLGLQPEQIDTDKLFVNYGLDSADAVVLSGEISQVVEQKFSPTLFWEYPTIEDLVAYLSQCPEHNQEKPQNDSKLTDNEPIAIIGIGCRFPGAKDPEEFWELLINGNDAITEVPKDRWDIASFYDPDPTKPGKMSSRWGGFLDEIDKFDFDFFGISRKEASRMDPQQRLLLEVSYEALHDCGIAPTELSGSQTGVFIGISSNDYSKKQFSSPELINAYACTGNAHSIAANRLSYQMDLRGPSIALDTACSSSLVAVHLACQSVRNGECGLALVGGVNVILNPDIGINFSKAEAMSPDGHCKPFDASANGYVRSEGAGIVVLKPLSRAVTDNDRIYAVIRGSAVNQDGRTNGLMAPSGKAQAAVLKEAYRQAGISPGGIQYIETHGTGTILGDPIEVRALVEIISQNKTKDRKCAIGSVKSNIGHLEAAAGIAGLIKTALSIKRGLIPPSIHFEEPNPHIDFNSIPLFVQDKLTEWPLKPGEHAFAGVSAFGFGGTNAHIVLEEAPSDGFSLAWGPESERDHLITLSAHTEKALKDMALTLRNHVAANETPLYDLCYTLNARRSHYCNRLAFTAKTGEDVISGLNSFLENRIDSGKSYGSNFRAAQSKVVYVFLDKVEHWRRLGSEIWFQEPVFREMVQKCDEIFGKPYVQEYLLDEKYVGKMEAERSRVVLFSLQIALAALWQSWGIKPDAIVGVGAGEVAAAYTAGVLSLEDATVAIGILEQGKVKEYSAMQPQMSILPLYSAFSGKKLYGIEMDSRYWTTDLSEVNHLQEAAERLAVEGYKIFLGIGNSDAPGKIGMAVDRASLLAVLGQFYTRGFKINWASLYPEGRILTLPAYPWQRERCWMEGVQIADIGTALPEDLWNKVFDACSLQSAQGPFDLALEFSSEKNDYLDRLTTACVVNTLYILGAFVASGEEHSGETLIERFGLLPPYQKLLNRWLKRLASVGLVTQAGDKYTSVACLKRQPMENLWEEGNRKYSEISFLLDYMKRSSESLHEVLQGKINPLELFFPGGSFETTENFYQNSAAARYYNAIARVAVESVVKNAVGGRKIRVLEVGAGTGSTTASILPVLPPERSSYYYTDLSDLFLERAKSKFRSYPFVTYRKLNIENDPAEQGFEPHSFDVVVAANVLHATRNLNKTFSHVKSLLAPGGVLVMWEVTVHQSWFDVTFGLIEGWGRHEDGIREENPLLSGEKWQVFLCGQGFPDVGVFPNAGSHAEVMGQHIIVAKAPLTLPEKYVAPVYEDLGTPNMEAKRSGSKVSLSDKEENNKLKVSEKKLKEALIKAAAADRQGIMESYLLSIIAEVMDAEPEDVDVNRPLNTLGLDSLMAIDIKEKIRWAFSVDIPVLFFMQGPSIVQLAVEVLKNLDFSEAGEESGKSELALNNTSEIKPAKEFRYLPFPLNDIQQAYWLGRSGAIELGNVSTHLYIEFESNQLDLGRLESAWNQLIQRHEMLKAIVLENGEQQILDKVPEYRLILTDVRDKDSVAVDSYLEEARLKMSHSIRPTNQWPLFDIQATLLEKSLMRVHFSIDFLIADAASLLILFKEWSIYYQNPRAFLEPLELSFRDYVLAENELFNSEEYQQSLQYWRNRVNELPPAPELPLDKAPYAIKYPRFRRRSVEIDAVIWEKLKQRAAQAGLTPSMVLCAAYAEILGAWSKNPRFTLTLTLFNRQSLHHQVNNIVGDFTSLILLEVDHSSISSFEARARNLQKRFWEDMQHKRVSGVRVLRELSRTQGKGMRVAMPVVFTSVLEDFAQNINWLGEVIYSISQTPQVWLDHQVIEKSGRLVLIWDAVEELFPAGMIDDMFNTYCSLLNRLGTQEEAWNENNRWFIPAAQEEQRKANNNTLAVVPTGLLHAPFIEQVALRPLQEAVVSSRQRITYEELYRRSNQLGRMLRHMGAKRNSLVAVVMEKGWEQVLAVLGILNSGATYVPIDSELPCERLGFLLEHTEAKIVLTQPWIEEKIQWPENVRRISIENNLFEGISDQPLDSLQKPEDLAYVIFTSGSTGLSKGVMIDHLGALNTIIDINNRFSVGPDDRILSVSALNFDLSVYDIFGTLAAGGTIVMPEAAESRNPVDWAKLMINERVTLWNSVPALMNILTDFTTDDPRPILGRLRLAMLSGDWIPVSMPDRIRKLNPKIKVISLGGATEASIWSILYSIETVDPEWKSIPYGKPMVNQTFHVLNRELEPCPVWVPGELFIGGIGLAKGYWRDEEKTNAKFITHPRTKERLYRTGDLGRYLPDCNIEFLGREDFQVKVLGYRIELGEIEAVLYQHDDVKDAVVSAMGDIDEGKRLVSFIVPKEGRFVDSEGMQSFLRGKLPDYMVPRLFVELDRLPLSPNGKVDRKALPEPNLILDENDTIFVEPRNSFEKMLVNIWTEILNIDKLSIYDNFFALGGNSLDSIQVAIRLQKAGIQVVPQQIFEYQTVAELAEFLEVAATGAGSKQEVLTENIKLSEYKTYKSEKGLVYDAFLTGTTGYLGVYLLRELLLETNVRVNCLVRAESSQKGRQRIYDQLHGYFPDINLEGMSERVIPICGDLTKPKMGIAPEKYQRLCDSVQAIYHSAALVSHVGDYNVFYRTNVGGTGAVIELAETGTQKEIHHISTVGVRGTNKEVEMFGECDLDVGQKLDNPYSRTKFTAEKMVRDAIARGCIAKVYRVGFVAADSNTGRFQQNIDENALYRYIKATIHMGVTPYLADLPLDFTPVDFVAKSIVAISRCETDINTFHIINPKPLNHYDFIRALNAFGYPIMLMELEEFMDRVFTLSEGHDYQAELGGIIGFNDISEALILQVDSTVTQRLLKDLNLEYPPVTSKWIHSMIQYCIDVGYIRPSTYWGKAFTLPEII